MALEFVLAGSGMGKSTYVQMRMIKDALESRDKDFYLIVPDQFTMATQKKMAESNPRGGILNIDVLSFSRLSYRIFSEVGRKNKVTLDDTGKNLLIRKAASAKEDSLLILTKGIGNIGWTSEVKSVISEFMQYGMSPEEIGTLSANLEDNDYLKAKMEDIRIIYDEFLKECGEAFLTRESILDELSQRIPLSEKLRKTEIVFDGFTGFTPIQIKVITQLVKYALKVTITFPFEKGNPYTIGDEDYLFLLTQKNIKALQESVQKEGIGVLPEIFVEPSQTRFEGCPDIAHLEANLFRNNQNIYVDEARNIEIFRADNIIDECRGMCFRLCEIIKEHEGKDECRYRDMAVITGNPEVYNPVLKRVMRQMGIPAYIDENRSLLMNPYIVFLRSALKCVKSGFKYEDVMTAVRCGFLDIEREEADMLDNYIRARKLRGFGSYLREFEYGTSNMSNPEEELTILNDVRLRLISSFEMFEDIKPGKEYKTVDLMKKIYGFAAALDIEAKLERKAQEFEQTGELALKSEYMGVYGKVCELFDQVVSIMGESPVTFDNLADILEAGYGELKCGVLPQGVDVLPVGDMQRSRLGNIKVLFFLGVDDSNIPKAKAKGGILSEMDKKALEKANFRLSPSSSEQTFIERLYLYLAVTKPTQKLYISYSTMAPDGKTLRPSYFIGEVKGLFKGLEEKKIISDKICVNSYDLARIVARDLPEYVSGKMSEANRNIFFDKIASLKSTDEGSKWLASLFASAFAVYEPGTLPREIVKELYGTLYSCSVSAVERYSQCPMSHFLRYGLTLKEREDGTITSIDIGNISHSVLERVFRSVGANIVDTGDVEDTVLTELTDKYFDEVIEERKINDIWTSSSEKFFIEQQRSVIKETVNAMKCQLAYGKFVPEMFEQSFTELIKDGKDYDGMQIEMKGRIDRVDICRREEDNLIKLVDYKTGSKSIAEKDVVLGKSLQLEVYMNQAIKLLEKKEGKKARPAAMLYMRVDEPLLDITGIKTDVETARKIKEEPTGVVLCDKSVTDLLDISGCGENNVIPVKFNADGTPKESTASCLPGERISSLLAKADQKTKEIAECIVSGKIETSPLMMSSYDACDKCPFGKCCGFDEKIPGYKKRDGDAIYEESQSKSEGEEQ